MNKNFKLIDLVVRYTAIVGLALLTVIAGIFALTALASPSSGDISKLSFALTFIVCAIVIWLAVYMAYSPKSIAKFTPLSEPMAAIVARVIVYPIGTALGVLLLRQVLLVAVPDILQVFQ